MEKNCKRKRKKRENINQNLFKQNKEIESTFSNNTLPSVGKNNITDEQSLSVSRKNKKLKNSSINSQESTNGLVLIDKYIPKELLIEIFCHINSKSLLDCQLVCRSWKIIIQSHVWHKKAEHITGQNLTFDKRIPWITYYHMCKKMPFNENLVKNHSGQSGIDSHWELPPIRNIKWSIEMPSVPLLPDDLSFGEEKVCFVTSSSMTWKYQTIDLIREGFSEYLLDYLQPTIRVSEWYSCSNTPAKYICDIELLQANGEKKFIACSLETEDEENLDFFDHHTYSRIIKDGEQDQWYKYEHEFKNYGPRLRKIKFTHGGRKINHYDEDIQNDSGTKMTRACIKIDMPFLNYNYENMLKYLPLESIMMKPKLPCFE